MAPRPLETREQFIERLRRVAELERVELRFGGHHFTHAVCRDAGPWTLRRLELDPSEAEAYLEKHGTFMPEHAEMLSKPGAVLLEADTLDELIAALARQPWPLAH